MKSISNRDMRVGTDIAETLIHFRRELGCFPTIDSMKENIKAEVSVRHVDIKNNAAMWAEDIIRGHDEWFNKESEPDEN